MIRYYNMIPPIYAPNNITKCASENLFRFSPDEDDADYIYAHVSGIIESGNLSDKYYIYANTTNTFVVVEVAKAFIYHKTPCIFSYMNEQGDAYDQIIYEHSIKEAGENK